MLAFGWIERWREEKRGPLVAVTTAIPVWNFYGFAINFFRDTWGNAPIPVIPISSALNAGFVLLLPFLQRGGRAELRLAALLGTAMATWSAVGMAFSPPAKRAYTAVPTVPWSRYSSPRHLRTAEDKQ